MIGLNTMCQQLSPEVIASAGDHFENGDISLSWTIGEPIISTFQGDYILTQGFHQNMYMITSVDDMVFDDFKINIFPNPTPSLLNIEIIGKEHLSQNIVLKLFDSNGRLLKEERSDATQKTHQWNLQSFVRSHYLLQIIVKDQIKTFKIIRN